jgi:NADPH:quinone reductase-like Zn-dependent oxidoreductase
VKLPYKIFNGLLIFIALAMTSLAIALSYTSACKPAPALSADSTPMKAIYYSCYGSPDVLELTELEKPEPEDDEILIKVHAASVNPYDWHFMRGSPYVMRLMTGLGAPDDNGLGADFAGTIEVIGKNITKFKPGDEVFGATSGAFSEYVIKTENGSLVPKPSAVSFEQGASVAIAAVTALQALRDQGDIKPGDKVLINGASGGVGTFAVQIAKSFGAEVSGVCSSRNVALVKSIGADHVFDYKKEDYTESGEEFDLIIDLVGNHSLLKNRHVLSAKGKMVIVGGPSGNWIGPLMGLITAPILSLFTEQQFVNLMAELKKEDLSFIGELIHSGKVKPVIDKRYKLSEVAEAIRYSETGRARGKIIIEMN